MTITFVIPRIGPADPVTAALNRVLIIDEYTDPEIIESMLSALKMAYGLEGTLWDQYVSFLQRAMLGDFGHSIFAPTMSVSEMIAIALPWTVGLLFTTTVLSWLLGNLIGVIAGYYRRRSTDLLQYLALIVQPIPYYIMALMVIFLFAYLVQIFPSSGAYSPGRIPTLDLPSILDILNHSFLPALSLVVGGYGWTFLRMQALVLTVKKDDYVLFAKMKGLSQNKVMTRYVMKNTMLPQFTQLAMRLGAIFNGALIMETIFAYPGLGYKLYVAITTFDLTLMMGIVTMSIFAIATAVLFLDILYPFVYPRIRFK
ncbi:MAG: ABC transporter permease [Methanobacteriota archaeon]|nr:MAG: ABC transporter permease [Euryarchaeota archaeon]